MRWLSHLPPLLLPLVFAMAIPTSSVANDSQKIPTIGEVFFSNPSMAKPWDEAFRGGLRNLGYLEGKNVKIVTRYAKGDSSQLTTAVNELLSIPVDVLYVSPRAEDEATKATKTIPIVCPELSNPSRNRMLASLLARSETSRACTASQLRHLRSDSN